MNGTTSNKTNVFAEYSDHIIVAFSLLLLIYTLWLAFRPGSKSELEILSDFSPVSNQERFYNLEGTIMHDGAVLGVNSYTSVGQELEGDLIHVGLPVSMTLQIQSLEDSQKKAETIKNCK